jgi:hypothetical protein
MLAFELLYPQVLIQFRPLSLKNTHKLINFQFQPVKVASIKLIVLIIHQVLEDRIAGIGIIS